MSTKEILKKQNQRNVLAKKSKEKLLLALLAGGLATCTINTEIVSATSVDNITYASSENIVTVSKANDNDVIPSIGKNNFTFYKNSPRDIVNNNVDLKNLSITELYIRDIKIDVDKLEVTNNSIRIPKQVIEDLSLDNGVYYLTFHFSNGVVLSNTMVIIIDVLDIDPDDNVQPPIVTPPDNNTKDDTVVPNPDDNTGNDTITPNPDDNKENDTITPNPDDNKGDDTITPNPDNGAGNDNIKPKPPADDKIEDITPTIEKQTIIFNRDRAEDIVIKNVNSKGLTLSDFYIAGRRIDVNKLKVTENSIIIPKEVIFNLYLKNSTYYTSAIFSNGKYVSGVAAIQIIDDGVLYPDDNDDNNGTVTGRPSMITQGFEFDITNPKGIEITYVNFNGNKLKSITIGNRILNSSKFTTTSNSIIISDEVLKSLGFGIGTYQFVFNFSNGSTLSGYSDLIVVQSTNIITKPSTDIIIDEDNFEEIEIPDLIPDDAIIDSITINNKRLDVVYRDLIALRSNGIALASFSGNPVVYIENNKLFIPTETLAYIGTFSDNYDINIRLDDGSTITQQLTVKSRSVEDNDIEEDKNNTITNSTSNIKSDTSSSTNTTSKKSIASKTGTAPKTGDVSSLGLIASLFTAAAGLKFTKKK